MSDAMREDGLTIGNTQVGFPDNTVLALRQIEQLKTQKKMIESAIKQREDYLKGAIPVLGLGPDEANDGDVVHKQSVRNSVSWAKAFTDLTKRAKEFIPKTRHGEFDESVESVTKEHSSVSYIHKFDFTDEFKAKEANEELFSGEQY